MLGKEPVRELERRGWTVSRQSGNHVSLKMNGQTVTVPVHSNQDLPIGTFRAIIIQAGINSNEFRR
jgi:predicted RNA binding protein YcfA (HicA-like mRNA interferase family)